MNTEEKALIPKIVDPKEYGLDEKQANVVESAFLPVITERESLAVQYTEIVTKEITAKVEMEARELRLKLVKVRTNTDRIHKTEKAFYIAGGRFVDAWKNKNISTIEQMEEKLKEIETTSERAESDRIKKVESDRIAELTPFADPITFPVGLGLMRDDVYSGYLMSVKLAYEAKIEQEKRIEAERIERARIMQSHTERKESILKLWQFVTPEDQYSNFGELDDQSWAIFVENLKEAKEKRDQENERIRLENERLQKEAELKAKELEAERKKQAEELAKQKAKADFEAKQQLIQLEKERVIAAAKQKAIEDSARTERLRAEAERQKLEAEIKAKNEAETKRIQAEKQRLIDEAAAKAKAAKAPDKEKLTNWIKSLNIDAPELSDLSAVVTATDIKEKFEAFKKWANQQIEKL
jgi:hypothetical protein